MRCIDIMNPNVHTCHQDDDVKTCAAMMRDHNIGFLPIVDDDGKVVGTLTDRDLCVRVLAEGRGGDERVANAMTRDVVACHTEDDIDVAEEMLSRAQISRLPVLDQNDRCVGVISLFDLARHEDPTRLGEVLEAVKDTASVHWS